MENFFEILGAAASQLAVGDEQGHLHVLTLPKNLIRAGAKEFDMMKAFLDREEAAVTYFAERRAQLAEMKEELEKNAEGGMEAEASEKVEDVDKILETAEQTYKAFELQWKAQLAEEEEQRQKKERGKQSPKK